MPFHRQTAEFPLFSHIYILGDRLFHSRLNSKVLGGDVRWGRERNNSLFSFFCRAKICLRVCFTVFLPVAGCASIFGSEKCADVYVPHLPSCGMHAFVCVCVYMWSCLCVLACACVHVCRQCSYLFPPKHLRPLPQRHVQLWKGTLHNISVYGICICTYSCWCVYSSCARIMIAYKKFEKQWMCTPPIWIAPPPKKTSHAAWASDWCCIAGPGT